MDFDLSAVREQVAALNPEGRFLVTSARTGEGMESWYALVEEELAAKRARTEMAVAP